MDPRIADFIAKNQGKYTREALRQQLIDAGYEPAAIDATWAILDTPDPDEASVAGLGFWPRFFLFLIGLNVAVFLVVALTAGMFVNLAGGGGALAGIFAVALGIGALIAWGIVAAVGPAKLGRTTALVIGGVIPLAFALLIGGTCFALASAIGPPAPPPVPGQMELQVGPPLAIEVTGDAVCYRPARGPGFNVYASQIGSIDGRILEVQVDNYEAQVGEFVTFVIISLLPRSDTDPPLQWIETPDTEVVLAPGSSALDGSVTFENLGPEQGDPDLGPGEPISGTITWTCEESAP